MKDKGHQTLDAGNGTPSLLCLGEYSVIQEERC